ncbi:class I SAM-dependent methyltransferase [Nonomuraea dietziae]|uniref:SAM-dependent methyltransferase n=1 Tax=Nonomuraea dietziae TaxID=65515 RepID=A0A7W5Y4J7_9ACTN|nr:class I SAM-dependent methyltransferase [Nonomuraea dietziae]MBB3724251.1 SAM-dependent methyltransferase [Nonomuraea dietziae]
MKDHAERFARVARGWDEAAEGYDAYFVPRFAPWVEAAVEAVTTSEPPEGPVLVPCCGTFPELDALIEHFPLREIVGIDLSEGMVRRARERAAPWPNVSVVEGDASTLDPRWSGRCGAVVSVFGLQQLPEPELAVRSWVTALRPAGRLSVVFWPDVTELDGPFALMKDVLGRHVPPGDGSWEERLTAALTAAGAAVERDERVPYPMSHVDAPTVFDAYVRSGPLRALATARGEAFVDRLREEFLSRAPAGEWHHRPHARLIVALRR